MQFLVTKRGNIKEFVKLYNCVFPFSLWYRKKYNISIASNEYKDACFFDMKFEYEQTKWLEEISKEEEEVQKPKREKNTFMYKRGYKKMVTGKLSLSDFYKK